MLNASCPKKKNHCELLLISSFLSSHFCISLSTFFLVIFSIFLHARSRIPLKILPASPKARQSLE